MQLEFVMPAKAGIHAGVGDLHKPGMDPSLRWGDDMGKL